MKIEIVKSVKSKGYKTVIGERQWFTNLKILVKENNKIIFEDNYNAKNKVVMISDTTPLYHEFQNNNLRIGKNNSVVDYNYMNHTTTEEVISTLISYINRLSL